MKKRKIKLLATLSMVSVMVFGFAGNVLAASSDTWNVTYAKGAPSGTTHPTDSVVVAYDSDGYRANCTKLTGSTDRKITITSSSAGGMTAKTMTTTGTTTVWKMKGSSTGNVTFKVTASASANCSSTGKIYISN